MLILRVGMKDKTGVVDMKRNGFTIIELMIVIVVAGILIGIAIPSFRTIYTRNALTRGEALVLNNVLNTKIRAAADTLDWWIIYKVTGAGEHTITSIAVGDTIASKIDTLPDGVAFTDGSLDLTFEFHRDGTASSSGLDTFSIKGKSARTITFKLVSQIGEVRKQ